MTTMMTVDRDVICSFQKARNARLVAAYEERLISMRNKQSAERRRVFAVDKALSSVAAAKATASRLRQQHLEKTTVGAASAAQSQFFRRQKVLVGPRPPIAFSLFVALYIFLIFITVLSVNFLEPLFIRSTLFTKQIRSLLND